MRNPPHIEPFFHGSTGTWTYVVHDGRDAVLIDPVLDYDHKSGKVSTASIEQVRAYLAEHALSLCRILETHAHADHLSAAQIAKADENVSLGIGRGIRQVQSHFANVFGMHEADAALTQAFDETYNDGDEIEAGCFRFEVMATPGHTPDSISYRIGDNVFVGDTLFAPDVGTARCDFPGGSVEALYATLKRLHALPADTRLWLCHDYPPTGRAPRAWVSAEESRTQNRMIRADDSLETFSQRRRERDATLPAPALLYPALQVNIRGGHLPEPEANGRRYLLTPLSL